MSKTFALNGNSDDVTSYMYKPLGSRNLIISSGFTNQQGNKVIDLDRYCGAVLNAAEQKECINKAKANNLHFKVVYQPAERFWLMQGIETSILLVMAGALVVLVL